MKGFLLTAFCFCLASGAHAQSDFRQGYVIMHAQDSLRGLISKESITHDRCWFKPAREAAVRSYTAADILGFGFDNDRSFVAKDLKSHTDAFTKVFVERVVEGYVSLFRHGHDFYVSKGDSPLYALTNERTMKSVNGRSVIVESNRYRGVLNHLMSDCKRMQREPDRVRLQEQSLIAVVEEYNACRDGIDLSLRRAMPLVHVEVAVAAGITAASPRFRGTGALYEPLRGDFGTSITPVGGVFLDISSPEVSQRVALQIGAFYRSYTTRAFHEIAKQGYVDRYFATLDMASLQIPLGLKYTFPERRITPYVNAGVINVFPLDAGIHWIREREANAVVETDGREMALNRKPWGLWGGVGLRRSLSASLDLFAECRYSGTLGRAGMAESLRHATPSFSTLELIIGIKTR